MAYLLLIFLNIIMIGVECEESVPILLWKNENIPIERPALSPLVVPINIFKRKYFDLFNSENIILFLQDTLSVEDFSSHEDVFNRLGERLENLHSLYIPAFEAEGNLAHSLAVHNYTLQTVEPGSLTGELQLSENSKTLVQVKLPVTKTNPSRKAALKKSVEVIENVLSKVGKKANFTFIFTGEDPSANLDSGIEHRRVARSLSGTTAGQNITKPPFFHTTCVNLYLRNDILLQRGNESEYTLHSSNAVANVSDCQEFSASLIISYKDVENREKVKVKFNFVRNARRWTFTDAQLHETAGKDYDEAWLYPAWPMEDIPLHKSYACAQKLILRTNSSTTGSPYKMTIGGMQVEAFIREHQIRFSDGWDCVGFFTIPIWTGIIAGAILIFILAVGMFMLMQVKTMDRFDDPKGKAIIVIGSNE